VALSGPFYKTKGFAIMEEDDQIKDLLKMLINITARSVFHEDTVKQLVAPTTASDKYFIAYNLCDGTRSQAEIARMAGLDAHNLSKAINRWIQHGIMYKVGSAESKPLHIYPLASNVRKKQQSDNNTNS
jgi:hypothetical protein